LSISLIKEHIGHFTPRKIYYQKAIQDYPITRRLLNYQPWESIQKIAYDKKEEINSAEYQPIVKGTLFRVGPHNHDAGRSILVIKRGPSSLVVEESTHQNLVSMEPHRFEGKLIYDIKLGSNCTYRCHYCYLFGAHSKNVEFAVYVDAAGMKQGMKKAVEDNPGKLITFNAGEHTDSLAFDPLTRLTRVLIPFITTLPDAKMELRTKSAYVENLRGLIHRGKTTVAWSLAPQEVIDSTEHSNAASFDERLKAMVKVQDWGYPIALKLDPVIPIEGWESHYEHMIARLSRDLNPDLIDHYSVGVIRMSGKLKLLLAELFPDSIVNSLDYSDLRKGKYTHKLEERIKIYLDILKLMDEAFPNLPFYISMEEREVADKVIREAAKVKQELE
jgi:spore photoproduct lyase